MTPPLSNYDRDVVTFVRAHGGPSPETLRYWDDAMGVG